MIPYVEEGDVCPCPGCDGRLAYEEVENCSCHRNPPCAACVDNPLRCPVCRWEEGTECDD